MNNTTGDSWLSFFRTAATLKYTPRHCEDATGRYESVAEHSWRLALMCALLAPEQGDLDVDTCILTALVHDLGEVVGGDVPVFLKSSENTSSELDSLQQTLKDIPQPQQQKIQKLIIDFETGATKEARFCKALDKIEAVMAHNEMPISTWLPLEYDLQLNHGIKECSEFPMLSNLRLMVQQQTKQKIKQEKAENVPE